MRIHAGDQTLPGVSRARAASNGILGPAPASCPGTVSADRVCQAARIARPHPLTWAARTVLYGAWGRSEEHTSELQSRGHLVCRLLLEKKKARDSNDGCRNKLDKIRLVK